MSYWPFILLLGFFFFLLNFPERWTLKIREFTAFLFSTHTSTISNSTFELEQLNVENRILKNQIKELKEILLEEKQIEKQWERLCAISPKNEQPFWKEFLKRRANYLSQLIGLRLKFVPAKIIFRDPSYWNSIIWVNVGEKDNRELNAKIISVNSPVIASGCLVGMVEYVGEKHAKVRLITDSGLVPSVRSVRGDDSDKHLCDEIDKLMKQLEERIGLIGEKDPLIKKGLQILKELKEDFGNQGKSYYLAKGEVMGTGNPLWKKSGFSLKGVGFNYDFEDKEGPSRILRTGEPLDPSSSLPPMPLIQVGDLLVTTGLDGVFPPDLPVARVKKINPLQEGGCSYDLEAESMVKDLDDIQIVFILPSYSFNKLF
ncbi:MAG: rod shape-determining protein MreC [Chlamydiae bacterium]|nr:rod shape-determining protein MreC [Chlamydiota bacterium]